MSPDFDVVRAIAAIAFAVVGFFVSKGLPNPKSWVAWVVWALGALLAGHVLPTVVLVGYKNTGVYFCDALQGLGIGILAGFMIAGKSKGQAQSSNS
jgi:hypothetical protein